MRSNGIFIVFLLYIISLTETRVDISKEVLNDGCKCIGYDCGCCKEIDIYKTDSLICANATYLQNDYGISVTVTFNNFTIINETVSARNPPPICMGEDVADIMEVMICLRIYDIDVSKHHFHSCFEIEGLFFRLKMATIRLGCIDTDRVRSLNRFINKYITHNTANNLEGFRNNTKPLDQVPSVIMV